jgi:hypothetical protein
MLNIGNKLPKILWNWVFKDISQEDQYIGGFTPGTVWCLIDRAELRFKFNALIF